MANHIFICYAREDKEFVLPLARNLKDRGVPIWLDLWDIPPGSDWDRSIDNAIYECAKFIIVLSEQAVNSSEVRGELRTAIDEKKPIIPVIRAPCRVPRQLRTIQHADFSAKSPDDEFTLKELVRTLETSTERVIEEPPRPPEPKKPERTWFQKRLLAVRAGCHRAAGTLTYRYAVPFVVVIVGALVWWVWSPKNEEPVLPPPPPPAAVEPAPDAKAKESAVVNEKPVAMDRPIEEKKSLAVGVVFRDRLKSGGEGPEMVVIPAGSFQMGDLQGKGNKDEIPVHTVQISEPFALSRFEVTFDEYDAYANVTQGRVRGDQGWGRGSRPVISVSWEDAQAYAKWLSEQTGKRYRLPSEAEWEYAARSGSKQEVWAGTSSEKDLGEHGWFNLNSGGKTQEVGRKNANGFGLHDMSGNVWEWVEDCWHGNYNGAPTDGSAWRQENGGDCGRRVSRGGSWLLDPRDLRSSNRYRTNAVYRFPTIGFRLAQDVK